MASTDNIALACLPSMPAPANLSQWAYMAIIASYPADAVRDTYCEAVRYIAWLDSLPVLGGSDND